MSNHYFQFKKFRVNQEGCAMKVGTDACLLGAWTASLPISPKSILDIGTGTGLLSLMLAQSFAGDIDAVEIDNSAAMVAEKNFADSPWKDKLKLFNCDILQIERTKKYDLIISNPPFFESSLPSVDPQKNLAKHDTGLTFSKLTSIIKELLNDGGLAALLIPYGRKQDLLNEALQQGLYAGKIMDVKDRPPAPFFRSIVLLGNTIPAREITSDTICIKEEDGNYSVEFTELLKEYYLYL